MPTLTPSPQPSTSTPLPRKAVLSELRHEVLARSKADVQWQSAAEGQSLELGGGVETKTEAKVRVDISDGTILRFAANTLFEFKEFSPPPTDPVTRLYLEAGTVWASVSKALGTGSFDVETPAGVAGVRGSMISVEFDPATGQMIVTCLEGLCSISGTNGVLHPVTAGAQAEIAGPGQSPTANHAILADQLMGWQTNFPEAAAVLTNITPMPTFTASPQTPTATRRLTATPQIASTASPGPALGLGSATAAAGIGSTPVLSPTAAAGANSALSPEEQANNGTFTYTFTATYSANCSGVTSGTRHTKISFAGAKAIFDWQGEHSEYNKTDTNTYQATDSTGTVVTIIFTLDGFRGGGGCARWVFKK